MWLPEESSSKKPRATFLFGSIISQNFKKQKNSLLINLCSFLEPSNQLFGFRKAEVKNKKQTTRGNKIITRQKDRNLFI